jgi:parallel beta-helix repeat protein
VHDIRENGAFFIAVGILIHMAPNNHIRSNVATNNGDGFATNAGFDMQVSSTNGLIVNNQFSQNNGNGIEAIIASDNYVVNNEMLGNTRFDASSISSVNRWNENNRCVTQTTPEPPPGVCGPDEAS